MHVPHAHEKHVYDERSNATPCSAYVARNAYGNCNGWTQLIVCTPPARSVRAHTLKRFVCLQRPDFTRHTSRVTHARTLHVCMSNVPGVCRTACQADCRQRSPQQRRASDLKTCAPVDDATKQSAAHSNRTHNIPLCAAVCTTCRVAYDKTYVVAVCGRAHTLAYKLRMVYTYGNYLSR